MNLKKIIKVISYKLSVISYFRWHPEVALRYLPIVKRIRNYESGIRNLKILEVGSGSLGIAPYLRQEVTGVDVDFSGPEFALLKQVYGKATKLPFADKSFDIVITVDLLEHLPFKQRGKVIKETLRVAKKEVIMAVPCGEKALAQDKKLDQIYRQTFNKPFLFLKEHLEHGLPEKQEILELIKKVNPQAKIKIVGNENLRLRLFLMKGWITKNIFLDFVFRKVFLLLIPLFRLLDRAPFYRQIFFVKINYIKRQ